MTAKIPSSDLPPIECFRCFAAAVETLNFRAAAQLVGLTPAALGQRIKQLEDHMGVALFERTTRSVTLTPAGAALGPYAQRCLDAVTDCVRAARGDLGPPPMEVVLGTRHELGMSWIVPELDRLARVFSHVTFHLYFGSGEDLLLRIRTREIDCAVTSTRVQDPRLDAFKLHEEAYVFVASRTLLAKNPFSRNEHAAKHTLIDTRAELPLFGYWRDAVGGGDRLRFARVVRAGTIAAIERMVCDGKGVAVLPRYLVATKIERGTLRELFASVRPRSDHFRLVFRADDPRRAFYDALARRLVEVPLR
jgi:DNA-binding transcriptional LysR family regulator